MSVTLQQRKETELKGRVEDPRLLTGRGRYVDDLNFEGQAYMGIVRTPFAHAKIKGIDLSRVRASPDFLGALTGEDLVKMGVGLVPQNEWPPPPRPSSRYHLAVDKVMFAGEPVAAVLSRTMNAVEDLVELVGVDYEPLPAVTSIEESKNAKTLVYEDWSDNVCARDEVKWGDAGKAIASAPFVVRAREGIARQHAAPMEPHSALVRYKKEEDIYEVFATVQSVHGLKRQLASTLNLPADRFHVKVMDVGGGFGSKGAPAYPEPMLACLFSRMTGLPVKWTATRTEEFLEAAAGRDEYCDITLACNGDGRIVGLKADVEGDVGVTGTQSFMSSLTIWTMLGHYKIPNVEVGLAIYTTNKMPVGPVRGAGAPEGCYFIERAMNLMAERMKIDPLELRRRNLTPRKPGDTNQIKLIESLMSHSRYEELLRWKRDVNSKFNLQGPSHSSLVAGLGVSFGGRSGFGGDEDEDEEGESDTGSSDWSSGGDSGKWQNDESSGGQEGKDWSKDQNEEGSPSGDEGEDDELEWESEYARVSLGNDGRVTVYTGSSPHGQGIETTFAQLASEELGVPLDRVKVVWGDSVLVPKGIGTFASRSAVMGGSAVVDACRKLKGQLIARVPELAGTKSEGLAIGKGMLTDTSRPGRISLPVSKALEGLGVSEISADSVHKVSSMVYSSGVHVCALTLDVELGTVKIVKYVVVEDCGRMINRQIVEGQLEGGVVHAVGGSLFEKLGYDEHGNLLTSTFVDYGIPTAMDSPDVEVFHEVTPAADTLNGAKGVGESGTIVGYAAVMNAVNDALSFVRPGAQVNIAPATPDTIVAALNQ